MCGIVGVKKERPETAKQLIIVGAKALQNRGQEACGFTSWEPGINNEHNIETYKAQGLVEEVVRSPKFQELQGNIFIGHLRFPTHQASKRNVQPVYASTLRGDISFISNGDLVNMEEQREFLVKNQEMRLKTTVDAEVIVATINYHISRKGHDIIRAITETMKHIKGSYSAALITEFDDRIFLFRDDHGIRPLLIGTFSFASESCAIEEMGDKVIGEVKPGKIVTIGPNGFNEYDAVEPQQQKFCIFELIYFQSPYSIISIGGFKHSCSWWREQWGILAAKKFRETISKEELDEIDFVSGIPRSGEPTSTGIAQELGKPYRQAVYAKPKSPRTFLEQNRLMSVTGKFVVIEDKVKGLTGVFGDDSTIEYENLAMVNQYSRTAGIKKFYGIIPSPETKYPCFLGIDTGCENKFIKAAKYDSETIRKKVGADKIFHLPLKNLYDIPDLNKENFCDACFSNKYPVEIPRKLKIDFCRHHGISEDYFDRTET